MIETRKSTKLRAFLKLLNPPMPAPNSIMVLTFVFSEINYIGISYIILLNAGYQVCTW